MLSPTLWKKKAESVYFSTSSFIYLDDHMLETNIHIYWDKPVIKIMDTHI